MTEADKNMAWLDSLLAEEAVNPHSQPDEAIMARILQEALDRQPLPQPRAPSPPWWRQLGAAIGGWQTVGGLIAATCTGVWLGINPPQSLPESLNDYLGLQTSSTSFEFEFETDLYTGFSWDIEESAI